MRSAAGERGHLEFVGGGNVASQFADHGAARPGGGDDRPGRARLRANRSSTTGSPAARCSCSALGPSPAGCRHLTYEGQAVASGRRTRSGLSCSSESSTSAASAGRRAPAGSPRWGPRPPPSPPRAPSGSRWSSPRPRRRRRVDPEPPRRLQVDVGRRLAALDLLRGDGRAERVGKAGSSRTRSITLRFEEVASPSGHRAASERDRLDRAGQQRSTFPVALREAVGDLGGDLLRRNRYPELVVHVARPLGRAHAEHVPLRAPPSSGRRSPP